jgi:SAM-dependent methyltransferase
MNTALGATFSMILQKADSLWGKGKQIHILEVGAGTGSATSVMLPLLENHGYSNLSFTYTYTDISSAYGIKAESKFSKYRENLIFKTFNVEEPPENQGFPPAYYHIVVASNVLHATVNLTETMKNTRELLRPRGLLLLAETFSPQRHYDIMVGHLNGYWRYVFRYYYTVNNIVV